MADKVSQGGMERYNVENQRSRDKGQGVPSLKPDGYKPKTLQGQRQDGAPGASSVNKTTRGTFDEVGKPTKGAGRARGVNCWYPNKGIAASGDSGESQRSSKSE